MAFPYPYKRRKLSPSEFRLPSFSPSNYPVDEDRARNTPGGYHFVLRTDSLAWGPPSVAASRALLEPSVTEDNESLFRSFHPSLACALTVGIFQDGKGRRVWFGEHFTGIPIHLYGGDLEIHVIPPAYPLETMCFPRAGPDLIGLPINPRRMLSETDVTMFARMYPRSIGIQILLAGRIHIIYNNLRDMETDWSDGVAGCVGSLEVRFSLLDVTPSAMSSDIVTGASAATAGWMAKCGARCLGLTIKLPSGAMALTSVTHGYVHLPGHGLGRRATSFYHLLKDILFSTAAKRNHETGAVTTAGMFSNNPIGKRVWAALSNVLIGTITETYDTPHPTKPYPTGYSHDLSLVTPWPSRDCPVLGPQPGMPMIEGWADLEDVLDGAPIFVTGNMLHLYGNQISASGYVMDATEREATRRELEALAEGHQYFFDRDSLDISVSLLWRCSERQFTTITGLSGSVLCLGRTTDSIARAVCFQNFEQGMCLPQLGKDGKPTAPFESSGFPSFNVKGGFLLPRYILESTIVSRETSPRPCPSGSFPARARASGDSARRNISGL